MSDSAPPRTVARQDPSCVDCSRQEYWSGLPFPSPGDLPDPGIEPGSPVLQSDCLPSEPPREAPMLWSSRRQILLAGGCLLWTGKRWCGADTLSVGKVPIFCSPLQTWVASYTVPHLTPSWLLYSLGRGWEELPGYTLTSEPPPLFSELLQSLLPLCKPFIFSKFPQTASV